MKYVMILSLVWALALVPPGTALSQETAVADEPPILQPPPELEGFERARWFYQLVAGPLVDSEREERLRRAEREFWQRVEEILAREFAVPDVPAEPDVQNEVDELERAQNAVPAPAASAEQEAESPALQTPAPRRRAPGAASDPLARAVADLGALERRLQEQHAAFEEFANELEELKGRLAELIRGRLRVAGGQ